VEASNALELKEHMGPAGAQGAHRTRTGGDGACCFWGPGL